MTTDDLVNAEVARLAGRGVLRHMDPDDLAQIGRLRAWRAVQAFDGRGRRDAYVRLAVRRALLDEIRRDAPIGRWRYARGVRAQHVPVRDHEHVTLPVESDPFVARAVAGLPPRYRALMAWRYWDDLGVKEIGARLGVGQSRVSAMHAAALARLRITLGAA